MTSAAPSPNPAKPLPVADGDFYLVSQTLSPEDNAIRLKVRAFMEAEVQPLIADFWERDAFPFDLLRKFVTSALWGCRTRAMAARTFDDLDGVRDDGDGAGRCAC
jgi:glutaryl-CoA dehydrogenase